MKFVTAVAGLFACLCLAPGLANAATVPAGTWLSADGSLQVHIEACGQNRLCGKVVWLGEPIDRATGRPKTDKHNPDPAKRGRPLIGLRVAQGLVASGPNEWSGRVYNADDGRTYQGQIKLVHAGTLRLRGCVLGILCKSQVWSQVAGPQLSAISD